MLPPGPTSFQPTASLILLLMKLSTLRRGRQITRSSRLVWSRPPPLICDAGDSLPCLHTSLERDVGPGSVRIVTEGGVGWGLGGYWPVGMVLPPRSHWEARGWGLVLMLCGSLHTPGP